MEPRARSRTGTGRRIAILGACAVALLLRGGDAPAEASSAVSADAAAPSGAAVAPEGAAPANRAASADAAAPSDGAIPEPVDDLRVRVAEVADDTATIELRWSPPSHGPRPDRYRAYLARVRIPQAERLGEVTTAEERAVFRIPLHPPDLNCCPVVNGRATYMDGPDAGGWGDVYPDGPYRQLLTAGVQTLRGDSVGLLATTRVDPVLEARRTAAAEPEGPVEDRPPAGAPADAEEEVTEGAEPEEAEPRPGEEGDRSAVPLRLLLGALVLLALGVLLALLYLRVRGGSRTG